MLDNKHYLVLTFLIPAIQAAIYNTVLREEIIGEGFHRILNSTLTIYGDIKGATLVAQLKFTNSVYVDPDQLKYVIPNTNVKICEKINTECGTWHPSARPFTAYVIIESKSTISPTSLNYILPFHVRYHKARNGGEYTIFKVLTETTLFVKGLPLQSNLTGGYTLPCLSKDDWSLLPYKSQRNHEEVLKIPVGDTSWFDCVKYSTEIALIGGVILVVMCVNRRGAIKPKVT